MKKVFRIISSYSNEATVEGLKRLDDEEAEFFYSLESDPDVTFLAFDGKICHWENGELMLGIAFFDDEKIEKLAYVDRKIHYGFEGYTEISEITEEVLYTMHDTSIYGFAESNLIHDFYVYREANLSKDDVLDKIGKHGVDFLTENDKLLLHDKESIHPLQP